MATISVAYVGDVGRLVLPIVYNPIKSPLAIGFISVTRRKLVFQYCPSIRNKTKRIVESKLGIMVIFVLFVIQALRICSITTAENSTKINLPTDDQDEAWRKIHETIGSNQDRRSGEPLSAFDQILLANAQSYGVGRSDSNKFLYQGDIVIYRNDVMELITGKAQTRRQKRAVTKSSRRLWGKNVPYYISRNLGGEAIRAIEEAIKEWENTLPCRGPWKRLTNSRRPRSYLYFIKGKGCYSKVGRTGGRQEVSVGKNCEFRGVVVHEIGHALGFWHEHSRPDRDKYVEVQWNNIIPDMKYNFEKYSRSKVADLGVEYDYQSIMHYGAKAFSKDGKLNTLFIKDKKATNIRLGQRSGLSARDKKQARLLYGCETTKQCKDLRKSCSAWAGSGHCTSTKYRRYMNKNCCRSCSLFKKASASPCNSSPCLNGGTCSNHGNRFKCKCLSSYSGAKCEQKKRPCYSSPCYNGGVCVNKGNTYECRCRSSYTGKRCEQRYSPCDSSPCRNGGKCVNQGSTFKCVCSLSYTGKLCEAKVVSNVCFINLKRKCPLWKGHCKPGGKYYKFMKTNCCKTCEAFENKNCVDKSSTRRCLRWKRLGFCGGRYEDYMIKNCAKTCIKC